MRPLARDDRLFGSPACYVTPQGGIWVGRTSTTSRAGVIAYPHRRSAADLASGHPAASIWATPCPRLVFRLPLAVPFALELDQEKAQLYTMRPCGGRRQGSRIYAAMCGAEILTTGRFRRAGSPPQGYNRPLSSAKSGRMAQIPR